MLCLIRHLTHRDNRSGLGENQVTVETQQLTIGRDADQHIQFPDRTVAPRHAIISRSNNGRIYIRALNSAELQVNGQACKKKALFAGDTIHIGTATITVGVPSERYAIVLTIDHQTERDEDTLQSLYHTRLSETRLNKRVWSWFLSIGILIALLMIPLSGILQPPLLKVLRENSWLPDDSLWSTGPLHPSHQSIGKECDTCHLSPFRMVRNHECLACHTDVQHHVDVSSDDVHLFKENRCAACHREHNEPSTLVERDTRLCTDCHAHLKKLKPSTKLADVTDFGNAHPDFHLTMLRPKPAEGKTEWETVRVENTAKSAAREQSFLSFSHKDHLNQEGIESPSGNKVLQCQDCHRPNTSGRKMLPIKMEIHCAGCHSLQFDENDLSSKVPHGNLDLLYKSLTKHFSLQYLQWKTDTANRKSESPLRRPGGKRTRLNALERTQALDWANNQALSIAQELLEERLCVDCHKISKIAGKSGWEQWYVEPVKLNRTWMPKARFDHASHAVEKCITCHENAQKSESSSDVLMPKIDRCRNCHGGAEDKIKRPSDCVMCHQFHLPKRGLFDPAQRHARQQQAIKKQTSTNHQ